MDRIKVTYLPGQIVLTRTNKSKQNQFGEWHCNGMDSFSIESIRDDPETNAKSLLFDSIFSNRVEC